MIELLFLGSSNAMTIEKYNTCFLIKQSHNTLLVDTGGGHEILKQFKDNNVTIADIDAIFISHSHIDHILGFPFLFRLMILNQKKMKIICSKKIKQELMNLLYMDIPTSLEQNKQLLDFHLIENSDFYCNFHFFLVDERQYGFILEQEGKKIVFMGDVPCNDENLEKVKGCDVLIHEAYCSIKDNEEIMHHHSTVEDVMELSKKIGAKKVVVIHSKTDLSSFASDTVVIAKEKLRLEVV